MSQHSGAGVWRIPRELITFSLCWKPEEVSSDATEGLSVSATGQMNLPTRVRVSNQKAKASFLTMSFHVDGLDLGWVFHINWPNLESPSRMCPAACVLLIPNEVKLTMEISHTVRDFKAPLSSVDASFTNKETFYSVELFRHQMTSHVIFCPADTEHAFFPAACGVLSKMNYFARLKVGLKRRWEKMGLIPRTLSGHSGAKLETNIPGNPRRKHKYLETEKMCLQMNWRNQGENVRFSRVTWWWLHSVRNLGAAGAISRVKDTAGSQ